MKSKQMLLMRRALALIGVAQWFGKHPVEQKVAGSIPGQSTRLGCGSGPPEVRACMKGNRLMFVSLSPSSPLSKNK